jgi:hypothetical protein
MPSWKLLYNIGQAEAASSRYGLALDAFERYLATGGDNIPEDRREDVIKETTRLRTMVGSIEIKAADGSIVFIDNVERGTAPLPGRIKVTAGIEHTVFVEIDADNIFSRTVIVSGGETISIVADTPKKEPAAVPEDENTGQKDTDIPSPVKKQKMSPLLLSGWILTGTGGATLLGGGIAGILAIRKNNDLKSQCDEKTNTCPGGSDGDIDSLKNASTASTVLLSVGGAITVAGVILLITGSKKREKLTDVSLIPVASPEFNGLQITGRF